MRKFVLIISLFFFALSLTAQSDSVLIITADMDSLTEAQVYSNPIYMMAHPSKRHLTKDLIRASACDCNPTIPNHRIGVFSVAEDKQVSFSQGNLQYLPALNLWKFADEQYECLGNANKYLTPTYRNWVDLFGWSADNTTAPFGVSTSTNVADYQGDFVDWGTNTICGDAPGTWRTLSVEEWEYIYHGRANAEKLFAMGTIEGNEGLILLPDDWILPQEAHFVASTDKGLQWKADRVEGSYVDENTSYSHFNDNIYTAAEWRVMEDAGAVFLPMANYRVGKEMKSKVTDSAPADGVGTYMTSPSVSQEKNLYFMRFHYRELRKYPYTASSTLVIRGRSVRLVRDTVVPIPEYVDLGLSVKWATFNVGATKPEEYGDYFAWGETEPKEEYNWATYKWCDGTSTNMTKYNTIDGKTILEPEDDAAHVHWGDKWRMPSKEEVDELTQQCSWIWTTHNNVNGYKVTGPNGNSIFLPAAGYKGAGPTYPAGEDGLYWTNTTEKQHYSYLIVLHDDAPPTQAGRQGTRCFGFAIRPVYDDIPDPCLVVKVNDTLSINMMCVEGGTFMMGSNDGDSDEKPVHEVTLSDYYIMQTEVTQEMWTAVMGTTIREHDETYKANYRPAGVGDDYPMYLTNKADCQAFIDKLNALTGLRFRLPTEAEWEYAARGGQKSRGYIYPGSNNIDEVAWYKNTSNDETHPVALKKPNELGIYDMAGNVWEWVSDWYGTYPSEAQTDPTGPATGTSAIARGGSRAKVYSARNCRNTERLSFPQGARTFIGMRLVLSEEIASPKRLGVFSVSDDKQVSFSQGNLQYIQSKNRWQFAEQQYEYMGNKHYRDGQLADTIEYFGWSGKNSKVPWGISLSTIIADYEGEFLDWGTNSIAGDTANTWYWVTKNGVREYKVVSKINGKSIFLPATGYRKADKISDTGNQGRYWTNVLNKELPQYAYDMSFSESHKDVFYTIRYNGETIRPVVE